MATEEIVKELTLITLNRAEAVAVVKALVEQLGGSGNTERIVVMDRGHVIRQILLCVDRTR